MNLAEFESTLHGFTGDHTKTTIIDKIITFVGGMNIGREYRYDRHDMMMEVTDPVVDRLQFEAGPYLLGYIDRE
jgi:phosphatidylserine/phosphatidylglycerophosphate/cardiolipin synthase-like enzyme